MKLSSVIVGGRHGRAWLAPGIIAGLNMCQKNNAPTKLTIRRCGYSACEARDGPTDPAVYQIEKRNHGSISPSPLYPADKRPERMPNNVRTEVSNIPHRRARLLKAYCKAHRPPSTATAPACWKACIGWPVLRDPWCGWASSPNPNAVLKNVSLAFGFSEGTVRSPAPPSRAGALMIPTWSSAWRTIAEFPSSIGAPPIAAGSCRADHPDACVASGRHRANSENGTRTQKASVRIASAYAPRDPRGRGLLVRAD